MLRRQTKIKKIEKMLKMPGDNLRKKYGTYYVHHSESLTSSI